MKNISLISLAIVAIMLFTYSCKKNETVDPLYYSNNGSVTNQITSSIQEFFNENKEESQFFTVDASSYNMVEGNQGIRIYFNPNSFKDQNGQIISGNVDIELIEIMTKSEMIHSNKPTNYPGNPNDPNDDEILVSGGEFYINATQNGADLVLNNQAQVRIPVDNPVYNMEVFTGAASDDIGIEWALDDSSNVTVTLDSTGGIAPFWYDFPLNEFGWINCDYFTGNTGPKVRLDISLNGLSGINDTNTVVFIVLPNVNSIGRCYNRYYDVSTNSVIVDGLYHFSGIPVGTSITLLAISKINNDYYYATINSTISSSNPNMENLPMTATTLADINTFINNL